MYAAIRKYGIEHFHISLLEETDNPEQQEIYWIKKLNSFHNGYNATIGGDGKPSVDKSIVIASYDKCHNQTQVAKECGISLQTVHKILVNEGIPIQSNEIIGKLNQGKKVGAYQNDVLIESFQTLADGARWIQSTQNNNSKLYGISSHIGDCVNGKRKTAYSYQWKSI